MTVEVDFVQGADILAPGLSRVERPLLEGLSDGECFRLRSLSLSSDRGSCIFAYAYGPLPLRLTLSRAALAHIANSWYAHLVPLLHRPTIVTCHDLIELEEMEAGERAMKPHRRFHLRVALRGAGHASCIACDSHATAEKVRHRLPAAADRVHVVYPGISPKFSPGTANPDVLEALGVRQPFVLFVGSEQPRKNLARLVEAVSAVRQTVPELRFVKVGGHQTLAGRSALQSALDATGMRDATAILEGIPDEQLVHLYRAAAVTVLPSLREGFGYPSLEAMSCGCPVVVSNRDSLPEVVGDAAIVIDPLDVRDIAAAIGAVLENVDLRARLRAEGPRQVSGFTWAQAVNGYRRMYEEALAVCE